MNSEITPSKEKQIPLVVDLDGSLIKTELPWESFLSVLFRHPIEFIKMVIRKIKVKRSGYLKLELEKWAELDLEKMPFSSRFVEYLKEEKAKGRSLILCTGSTQSYAEKIQKITGLFDAVWGCTPGKNIVGHKKAMFLVGKYGEKQFDYAGNSLSDLKVARYARNFILVNPSLVVSWCLRNIKVHRRFQEKQLEPTLFSSVLGFPLWFLNSIIFVLPLFVPLSNGNLLFPLIFSVVSFNFLGTGFSILFQMAHVELDRKSDVEQPNNNLFSTGDLSLSLGCFLSGLFIFLALISIIYLMVSRPLTIVASLLYIPCVYVLVYKKIWKWPVSSLIGYLLLASVVLLQGMVIILF